MHDKSIHTGNHTWDCNSICDQCIHSESFSGTISYPMEYFSGGNSCVGWGSDDDHMRRIKSAEGQKYH